jgi:hypothetical protein
MSRRKKADRFPVGSPAMQIPMWSGCRKAQSRRSGFVFKSERPSRPGTSQGVSRQYSIQAGEGVPQTEVPLSVGEVLGYCYTHS